ncbi:MAG: hypothetical protein ACP5E3_16910 [Bacteroidales bacterium]
MEKRKLSVIKDYDKLEDELKEKVKLFYPLGFSDKLIEYTDKRRKKVNAIRFETRDKIYMLRLSSRMVNKMKDDENFLATDYDN